MATAENTMQCEQQEPAVYGPTVTAFLYTLTSSAWLPIAAAYVAWQLGPPYEQSTLHGAISASLFYKHQNNTEIEIANHMLNHKLK